MTKPVLAAAAVIAFCAAPASAQSSETKRKAYTYHFEDDDLLGSSLNSSGDLIDIRIGPSRVLLIRPRVSFVTELQKAAERF